MAWYLTTRKKSKKLMGFLIYVGFFQQNILLHLLYVYLSVFFIYMYIKIV